MTIYAQTFGVSASNPGANNNIAMAAAASSGVSEIVLPGGRLKFSLHNLMGTGAINVTRSITIRGLSRNKTILKGEGFVEGDYKNDPQQGYIITQPNDNYCSLFNIHAGKNDVALLDMTLEGPDVAEITGDLNVCWGIWCGGGGSLRLERVDTRLWNQAIKCSPEYPSYPGIGTKFEAVDCVIGYRSSSGTLHIEGRDLAHDSCDFVRCTFEYDDGGTPTVAMQPTSNGEYPCTYVNCGVSFSATDCHFKRSGRGTGATSSSFGWLHFGSDKSTGPRAPRYARAVNCVFDSELEHGMLAAATANTQIVGCTFRTRAGFSGILPFGPITVYDCTLLGAAGSQYGIVDENGGEDVAATIIGCRFGQVGQGDGYVYGVRRIQPGSREWNIIGCTFSDINPAGSAVGIDFARVAVQNSIFQLGSGAYSVRLTGGTGIVNNCHFNTSRPVYVDGFSGDALLELQSNSWDVSAPTQVNYPGPNTVKIGGSNNRFFEGRPGIGEGFFVVSLFPLDHLAGDMSLRHGVGNYTFNAGTGTLTGSWNYDTLMLDLPSGSTVQNLLLEGSNAAGVVPTANLRFCAGTMKIQARQPFNLGVSGNILPKGGARRVERNEVLILHHFPASMKWVEIAEWHQSPQPLDGNRGGPS